MQAVKNLMQAVKTSCKRSKTSCKGSKLHASGRKPAFQNLKRSVQTHDLCLIPSLIETSNWERGCTNMAELHEAIAGLCGTIQRIICSYQLGRDPCDLELLIYQVAKVLRILTTVAYCSD